MTYHGVERPTWQRAAQPNGGRDWRGAAAGPCFTYRHVISFEETNVVGNVYFVRHVAWQGRCREMFLKARAPAILDELVEDLRLVTLKVSCEYHQELHAFDEIDIEMRLADLARNRIRLAFSYWRCDPGERQLVATGEQDIGCMRLDAAGLTACAVPAALEQALQPYRA